MRLDKWLWAARWFKTRGLAQLAIASGQVKLHEEKTKPAHALKVGDQLEIRVGESVWQVEVTALSDKRGPAAQARKLYAESEASRAERERRADLRRYSAEPARTIKGRPTKRDRRKLEDFTGSGD
ncbi:MAG: RNA-binding S4 domain-containing protein [Betaproteobacteria bacterium]|nr:RNA-binding S4 domain-containing protein [Betaproteobacteria bacterium]